MQSTATSSSETSRFLSLPAELRLTVYTEHLSRKERNTLRLTCKQLSSELDDVHWSIVQVSNTEKSFRELKRLDQLGGSVRKIARLFVVINEEKDKISQSNQATDSVNARIIDHFASSEVIECHLHYKFLRHSATSVASQFLACPLRAKLNVSRLLQTSSTSSDPDGSPKFYCETTKPLSPSQSTTMTLGVVHSDDNLLTTIQIQCLTMGLLYEQNTEIFRKGRLILPMKATQGFADVEEQVENDEERRKRMMESVVWRYEPGLPVTAPTQADWETAVRANLDVVTDLPVYEVYREAISSVLP